MIDSGGSEEEGLDQASPGPQVLQAPVALVGKVQGLTAQSNSRVQVEITEEVQNVLGIFRLPFHRGSPLKWCRATPQWIEAPRFLNTLYRATAALDRAS